MRVWIGLKQDERCVHEWVGEITQEGDLADAVRYALVEYQKNSGQQLWGITIMVDKKPPPAFKIIESGSPRSSSTSD